MRPSTFQRKQCWWGILEAKKYATVKVSDLVFLRFKSGEKDGLGFGGSQGALKINQAIIDALPLFAQKSISFSMRQVNGITKRSKKNRHVKRCLS